MPPSPFTELRFPKATFLIPVFVFLIFSGVHAQSFRQKSRRIAWPADSVFVPDSLTTVAPSLRSLEDTSLRFSFDFKKNLARITAYQRKTDSISITYSVFPFAAYKPYRKYNPAQYDSLLRFADYPGRVIRLSEKREELFPLPGIQKSGVISRGLSIGNGQNGFVNSAMNLQLEGNISKDIRLTAVLSDQSLPFQPQGNTQQIRELDRIFIRLEHKHADLLAGDVLLRNRESSFLRFYRNIQGAELLVRWDSLNKSTSRIAAGIAKGRFASVVVQVKEGVHGPYRLRAPDNPELLFVILAGSERVYFDNRLLKRGFNQDYVIDYNSGEITLNNHLLVTRFTRLRCDFEYSEKNYSRSSVLAEHEEKIGKADVFIGHYQEQDNPYQPLGFTLDSSSNKLLQLAGDNPALALLSGESIVPESQRQAGQLYYVKRDTILNGKELSWYKLASESDKEVYRLVFSQIGPGLGDYRFVSDLGNGKLFEYVGPGQGEYSPSRQAVLPNRKAMSRAGLHLDLGKGHSIFTEAALSVEDANRLSKLDESNNNGNAQKLAWRWKKPLSTSGIEAASGISYNHLSRNFRGIDRFRDIEFERNWNGNLGDTLAAVDHLIESDFSASHAGKWKISLQSNWRKKGDNIQGFQQTAGLEHRLGPLAFKHGGFLLKNDRVSESTGWRRLETGFSMDRWRLVPSWKFQLDENEILDKQSRKVKTSAMHYRAHSIGLRSRDSGNGNFSGTYTYREDKLPINGAMVTSLYSQNAELISSFSAGLNHQFELAGNYRQVNLVGSSKGEENLSARLDYRGSAGDGFLRQELVITANTGQEARRSFQFIRINAIGEGSHQWIDYNGNGLQELDEFVEAQRPEDRQYIKIFIPTQDFITAYTRSFNYRLNLSAPAGWRGKSGLRKLASRFALLSSVSEDRKITSGNLAMRYLPFSGGDGDNVLSATGVFRNTLFFNRNSPDFGLEAGSLNSLVKTLLSNGFGYRQIAEQRFLIRKNLGTEINLSIQFLRFNRQVKSDALARQNYQLSGYEAGPELAFQPNSSHRISALMQYSTRQNRTGEESARLLKTGIEYRGGLAGKRNINAGFRLTDIVQKGNLQSPASYEMLEGLLPGRNFTWTLNIQQKLARGLQLLLTYEGRKSENQRIVHIGKMQANLLF